MFKIGYTNIHIRNNITLIDIIDLNIFLMKIQNSDYVSKNKKNNQKKLYLKTN